MPATKSPSKRPTKKASIGGCKYPLLVRRAKPILPCDGDAAQNGVTFDDLGRIDDAALLVEGDRIAAVGSRARPSKRRCTGAMLESWTLRDCVVVPGFVDAHAHPLFAGDREPDFAARQRGEKAPLGMLYTVEQTRDALVGSANVLRANGAPALENDACARHDHAGNKNRVRAARTRRNAAARHDSPRIANDPTFRP